MPYKRKYRKRRRRRRGRKVVRYRRPQASLFGQSRLVRLKYAYFGQLGVASDAGPFDTHVFAANSLHDPLVFAGTGIVGAQPRGYDQITPLFDKYAVLGSRVKVTFMPHTGQHSGLVFYLSTTLSDNFGTAGLLTGVDALESRTVSTCRYADGQGARGLTLTRNFSAKKFFHVQSVKDNQSLQADVGYNPTQPAYFRFSAAATHSSMTNMEACDYVLEISYVALFTDPVLPDQS